MKAILAATILTLSVLGAVSTASATEDGYHWAYPQHLKYTLKYGSSKSSPGSTLSFLGAVSTASATPSDDGSTWVQEVFKPKN